MINLIPPHARKAITREYWIRVVTVWMFLATFALMVIVALQIPTYVLINSLDAVLEGQFSDARTRQVTLKSPRKRLQRQICLSIILTIVQKIFLSHL